MGSGESATPVKGETMRKYIKEKVTIDGRNIPYPVFTASQYLKLHDGISDVDGFQDAKGEIYERITQILALKQSCFLLLHTTHSCQSLSDGLYDLKLRLITELRDNYNYEFDDRWMEELIS